MIRLFYFLLLPCLIISGRNPTLVKNATHNTKKGYRQMKGFEPSIDYPGKFTEIAYLVTENG